MKLLFIDETSDSNKKDYFGICAVLIDSRSYKLVKESAQKILYESGWDPDVEFKGSVLFSAKSGDTKIGVEQRIELAKDLLALNFSGAHGRMQFAYCDFHSTNFKDDYLGNLPMLLKKLLITAPNGASKNLLSVHYDNYDSISPDEVRKAIKPIINLRKYHLFEDVVASTSSFETVGILYADLVAYLYGRYEVHSKDVELFKDLSPEQLKTDGRNRKLQSSVQLLKTIKNLKGYEVT